MGIWPLSPRFVKDERVLLSNRNPLMSVCRMASAPQPSSLANLVSSSTQPR